MRSLDETIAGNDEVTIKAREDNLTPYVPEVDSTLEVKDKFWKALPELGYFVPTGWEHVRDLDVGTLNAKQGLGYGFAKHGVQGKRVIREFRKVL